MKLLSFLIAAACAAQTQVNLRTQSREVDFSGAATTKPAKAGTTLPASCSTGELFFKLDATAGQNLYACTGTNTWTQIIGTGGGGGGTDVPTNASELLDFKVTRTNSTTLTIASSCTTVAPCRVRFGNRVVAITASATASYVAPASGMAFIYISNAGALTVGYDIITVTCSGCTATSGVTSFPADSIPLATWTATGTTADVPPVPGKWDVDGGIDFRGFLSTKAIAAGAGLVSTEVNGLSTLSIDDTLIGVRVGVPSTSTTTCTQGSWAASTTYFYACVAANTWRRVAVASW
jgi:hypothetical protein